MSEYIPDFKDEQFNELISGLVEKKTCIFFGAGISEILGYPSWKNLANNVISGFWGRRNEIKKGKIERTTLETLSNIDIKDAFEYLYELNKDIFCEEVEKSFNNVRNNNETNKIYKYLKDINLSGIFVTTNLDKEFQNFLQLREEEISICPDLPVPPKKLNYIHGRIDKRDSWVLTRSQYNYVYLKTTYLSKFLTYIFENYNVFFIEYGLNEHEILNIICKINKRNHYFWLEATYRRREDELKIKSTNLKKYNITLIPYIIETADKSEVLIQVLEQLVQVLKYKRGEFL